MPATPARIAFITQPYRKAIAGPNSTVESTYGDLARKTDSDSPIPSDFDDLDDAQAMVDERLALMSAERGRFQASLPDGLNFAFGLDYSEASPTGTVIDPDRNVNRAALLSELRIDLRRGTVEVVLWG